jgi:peptidoglycan glycosyltransferase
MSPVSLPPYLEPGHARRRGRRRGRTFASRPRRRRLPPVSANALIMVLAAVAGIVGGLLLLRAFRDDERPIVEAFARAWQRGDYPAMYRALDADSRRSLSFRSFRAAYHRATVTATATGRRTGEPRQEDDAWLVPVTVNTRVFGPVRGTVRLRMSDGDERGVRWSRAITFPGQTPTSLLKRRMVAPRRAPLLARDGQLLADSDGQQTELGAATGVVGELGEADGRRRRELIRQGFPADTFVGVSGLQRALDVRLIGRPGGTLSAGGRVLARARAVPAPALRASLDPAIQQAAQSALGGQFGGVAAVEPSTGEVLALAGIARDGAQPPGSAFKIITVTAALETGKVKMSSRFPVQTGADVGGHYIANAHDEACGGDLTESFAKSCNSVFGPLGVDLGGRRLVDASERFGFNRSPGIPGAKPSTIPPPAEMTLADVGASAIGQGRVLATPLGMAQVGAVIANRGRRAELTLVHGEPPRSKVATTPEVAALVHRLMRAVINYPGATGGAAAVPGGEVAGKTGTAELGGDQPNDAWFVAFAPASRPKLSVGVLVVHGGFGGDTAAPIARHVLEAGLEGAD